MPGEYSRKGAAALFVVASTVLLLIGLASPILCHAGTVSVSRTEEVPLSLGLSDDSVVNLHRAVPSEDRFNLDSVATIASKQSDVAVIEELTVLTSEKEFTVGKQEAERISFGVSSGKTDNSSERKAATSDSTVGWIYSEVSWYGPRFYGNRTADGTILTRSSVLVASRTLPFGTKVEIVYNGKSVIAEVHDRGPYVVGRDLDIGPGAAKILGFSGVHVVKYRLVP
ncbi:MAG: hypothetical protein JJE36_02070 [Coriobacteriia bacterium]|nr:hypothetical protein [Coriobacteriia bacterium]